MDFLRDFPSDEVARSLKEVKLPPLVHPETLLAAAKRCTKT